MKFLGDQTLLFLLHKSQVAINNHSLSYIHFFFQNILQLCLLKLRLLFKANVFYVLVDWSLRNLVPRYLGLFDDRCPNCFVTIRGLQVETNVIYGLSSQHLVLLQQYVPHGFDTLPSII